ncbi:MAG: hypothetical protein ACWA5K_09730, partial [bacterium]
MPGSETDKPLLFFDERKFLESIQTGNTVGVFKDALAAANAHFNLRFEEGDNIENLIGERALFLQLSIKCIAFQ